MGVDPNELGRPRDSESASTSAKPQIGTLLPFVGLRVHYYGNGAAEHVEEYLKQLVGGPFAALVVDVGPGPMTVTLKITDRSGRDHVRANVEYGDPGWLHV